MKTGAARTVRGACPHDCPDTCAWHVAVEDGGAVELVGDPEHPIMRGGLCAKVNHYLERVYSSDRILYPMRRVGPKGEGTFERVGWDETLDEISARLKSIIREDGSDGDPAVQLHGTQGLIQAFGMDRRFFARLGATRLERNICGSAGSNGVTATIGTTAGMLPKDIVHGRFILWAPGPHERCGGFWQVAGVSS